MSVEPATGDSTDSNESAMSYEEAFELLMEELPERFQEFSKTHVNDDKELIILTPETPMTDNNGTVESRIMTRKTYRLIEKYEFTTYMITQDKNGVGIDFWYKYDPA